MVRWKNIPDYDGKYQVSSDGKIVSRNGELSPIGGVGVNLCKGGVCQRYKIAYLVARAFVGNPEMREFVRHKNGDVTDNRASNLEWSDRREDNRYKDGIRVIAWNESMFYYKEFPSILKASEVLGVARCLIYSCLEGEIPMAGGLYWKYKI